MKQSQSPQTAARTKKAPPPARGHPAHRRPSPAPGRAGSAGLPVPGAHRGRGTRLRPPGHPGRGPPAGRHWGCPSGPACEGAASAHRLVRRAGARQRGGEGGDGKGRGDPRDWRPQAGRGLTSSPLRAGTGSARGCLRREARGDGVRRCPTALPGITEHLASGLPLLAGKLRLSQAKPGGRRPGGLSAEWGFVARSPGWALKTPSRGHVGVRVGGPSPRQQDRHAHLALDSAPHPLLDGSVDTVTRNQEPGQGGGAKPGNASCGDWAPAVHMSGVQGAEATPFRSREGGCRLETARRMRGPGQWGWGGGQGTEGPWCPRPHFQVPEEDADREKGLEGQGCPEGQISGSRISTVPHSAQPQAKCHWLLTRPTWAEQKSWTGSGAGAY